MRPSEWACVVVAVLLSAVVIIGARIATEHREACRHGGGVPFVARGGEVLCIDQRALMHYGAGHE